VAWAEAYIRTEWYFDPSSRLATTDMGRKMGALPLIGEGELGTHLTKSLGPRPTSIPSGILIYAAIWPQQTWANNWGGSPPFWGEELGPNPTQCGQAEAYLLTKFHLDPSNRLATIHQHYRQTGQTDRRDNGLIP